MTRAREVSVFTLVGTTAATLHVALVAGSVPFGLSPLAANLLAFVFSFSLSFWGHARWSFPAAGRPVAVALKRFAVLSVVVFGFNEAAYAGALAWTPLDYRSALVLVFAALGSLKLLASKYWAFATP